jgi:hypothetical protein
MAFITEPGPIRKILTHLGEPLRKTCGHFGTLAATSENRCRHQAPGARGTSHADARLKAIANTAEPAA